MSGLILPSDALPPGNGAGGHLSASQRKILALEGERDQLKEALGGGRG